MLLQSRMTQQAVAAMSRLAETHAEPGRWLSSAEIARDRSLNKPIVAKILSVLSQGRLVVGSPGPGGGYRLARSPSEISLLDVALLFEVEEKVGCPYGPGWCDSDRPHCPLHESLSALRRITHDYLRNTRFDVFAAPAAAPHDDPQSPPRNGRKRSSN